MKKHRQGLLLAIMLAVVLGAGLGGSPAMAVVDNSGILRDTVPQDDSSGHYEQISGSKS